MEKEKLILNVEQALYVLKLNEFGVHTYIQGNVLLLGCNWSFETLYDSLENATCLEVAGINAKQRNHGLALTKGSDIYFLETDATRLKYIESKINTQ